VKKKLKTDKQVTSTHAATMSASILHHPAWWRPISTVCADEGQPT